MTAALTSMLFGFCFTVPFLVLVVLNLVGLRESTDFDTLLLMTAVAMAVGVFGYFLEPKTSTLMRMLNCSRYDVEVNQCGDGVGIELVHYWRDQKSDPLVDPTWWRTTVLSERHDADKLSAVSERLVEIQQQAQALTLLARADYEGLDLPGALTHSPEQIAEELPLRRAERQQHQLREEAEAQMRQLNAQQSVAALRSQLDAGRW